MITAFHTTYSKKRRESAYLLFFKEEYKGKKSLGPSQNNDRINFTTDFQQDNNRYILTSL